MFPPLPNTMNELLKLIHEHPVYCLLGAKAVWGAFVDAFPAPSEGDGKGYKFAFTFVNLIAFNFARAKGASIEQSPNFIPAAEKYIAAKQRLAAVTDWQQIPEEKK